MDLSLRTVKRGAVCAILLAMPLRSTVLSQGSRQIPIANSPEDSRVRGALDWFKANETWIEEQQIRLTEIPAPVVPGREESGSGKGAAGGRGIDDAPRKLGNVIGELKGANDKEMVLVTAHLDTVFPEGTVVRWSGTGNV